MERPGGNRSRSARRRRLRSGAAAALSLLALSLAACGGDDSSQDRGEAGGAYPVEVVTAEFPTRQRLGQTSLLRIGVRNSGEKALPALTVTISVGGEEGQGSSLPFGIRSPEPGLAQPDRPVWALAETYPRLAGSDQSAGAESSIRKTFDFGPLKRGATAEAVWKLTASRTGSYRLLYGIGAGLGGGATAETASGVEPGGSFAVRISEVPPETIVTDSGEVVEIPRGEETRFNR